MLRNITKEESQTDRDEGRPKMREDQVMRDIKSTGDVSTGSAEQGNLANVTEE